MNKLQGSKIKVHSGKCNYIGLVAYCTYDDGDNIQVTPVRGDPLISISLKHGDVEILDINDCQCVSEDSFLLDQCDKCPR